MTRNTGLQASVAIDGWGQVGQDVDKRHVEMKIK